jgi:hypothetical protein
VERKEEGSLHRGNLVGSYVEERSSLQEGGADHQSMVTRPSYQLTADADKRASYHFNPCTFSQIVTGFHHGVDRRNLLEKGDFFRWNGFGSHGADNANDTRCL